MYDDLVNRLHRYSEACVAYKLDADFASAVQEAADVIERKKGKWMPSSLTWSYYNYDCSVCGCNEFRQVDHNGGYKAFNFCPNCGADMRGEDDV